MACHKCAGEANEENNGEGEHSCPFQEDIADNHDEHYCSCCETHTQECIDDI